MNKPTLTAIVAGGIIIGIVGVYSITSVPVNNPIPSGPDTLTVCTFNIKWIGSYTKKDNAALAGLVAPYDVVVVQELVSAPVDGTYPDGVSYTADAEAKNFIDAMGEKGFNFMLSSEDTGPGQTHSNGSSTEWFICFYKPGKCSIASDLPQGFVANDRFGNPVYTRVPYAFPIRSKSGVMDFVLISVHLAADAAESAKRQSELAGIASWTDQVDSVEKDFIILGDMNIQNCTELQTATPAGFLSLNNECRKTTTGASDKPYDHIMYRPENTAHEMDTAFDCYVLSLVDSMKSKWTESGAYPGNPYNANLFPQYYSDHNPVVFRLISKADDDGIVKPDCRKDCPKAQRISAKCKDGTTDSRTGSGACSGHGGVDCWECK